MTRNLGKGFFSIFYIFLKKLYPKKIRGKFMMGVFCLGFFVRDNNRENQRNGKQVFPCHFDVCFMEIHGDASCCIIMDFDAFFFVTKLRITFLSAVASKIKFLPLSFLLFEKHPDADTFAKSYVLYVDHVHISQERVRIGLNIGISNYNHRKVS